VIYGLSQKGLKSFIIDRTRYYGGNSRRHENGNEERMSKTSSWFAGALLGGVMGSALVLLLTPFTGQDLKKRLTDYVENIQQEIHQAGVEKRVELETQLELLRSGKEN
jgi:hypothetical protein